jgi:glycerophosphoryl diester phosphodiesterase
MTSFSYKFVIPKSIQLSINNIRQIFIIHLLYSALAATIFAPLTAIIGRLLLQLSGKPMLSDFDIVWFILSPAGIVSLIFFASLLITVLVFEQTSLMALLYGHLHKQQLTAAAAVAYTARHSRKIFLFALQLVMRLLFITLPPIGLSVAIAWFTITDYDINYYLTVKPPVFLITVAIIITLLLFTTQLLIKKLFCWSLSLPILLFSDTPASKLFSTSAKQIQGYKKELTISLAFWAIATLVIGSSILGGLHFLGSLLVPRFLDSIPLLLLFLTIFAAVMSIANFLITSCSSGNFTALLMLFYQDKSHYKTPFWDGETAKQKQAQKTPFFIVLLLISCITALWGSFHLFQDFKTVQDIQIIAHRGAAGKAPENTVASIQQAITDGTDWVEIDVQETMDGEVIVIHDSDFMKLAGVNKKVWDITYNETLNIDIGSWFGKEFAAERTPTLGEVLQLAKGKTKVLIELKYYGHTDKLEQRVADIVEQTGMTNNVAIMSLKLDGIQKFHNLHPKWSTGLLTTKAIGKLSAIELDFMAINMAAANPAFIRSIHNDKKDVYVWTVNEQIAMFRMMSLGVDGIITDEPELAVSTRKKFMELDGVERLAFNALVLFNKDLPQRVYRDNSP